MSGEALAASHRAWPELAAYSQALIDAWPPSVPGLHRIDLTDFHATLDLGFR
jgi:tRNA 5-methylaminomethyl-2-thiouridine biosynthesis bifunctional protein